VLSGEAQLTLEITEASGAVIARGATGTYVGRLHDMPMLAIEGVALEIALWDHDEEQVATCRLLSEREFEVGAIIDVAVVHVASVAEHAAASAAAAAAIEADPFGSGSHNESALVPHRTNESVVVALDDDDEPTGVSGTLREMPVIEIVQMLAAGRRTAVVDVKGKGSFAVEGGAVVAAHCGSLVSNEAFVALYALHRGAFRIRYGRKTDEKNIFAPTTFLLLEAARLFDEATSAPPPLDDRVEDQAWQVVEPSQSSSTSTPRLETPSPYTREPTLRFRSLLAATLPDDDPAGSDTQQRHRDEDGTEENSDVDDDA
jgi:hypothetical protein